MIKSALSVLPTRPVVFIVPVLVVVVMSFYYWDHYKDCTNDKQLRASLSELLYAMDSSTQLRLKNVTKFAWDKVKILNNYKPENKITDCPLGWDWSATERESLIASGLLGILIFGYEGLIVEHVEFRNDQIAFEEINTSLSPDTAIFTLVSNQSDTGISLHLVK